MTPVGDGRFLMVNYRNVYLLDTDPFSVKPVTIDTKLPTWNPTAITRSESNGSFVSAHGGYMSDEPLHMSIRARNQRLYETLLGMGLHVDAVRSATEPDAIDYVIVSAGLLPAAQGVPKSAAIGSVAAAVERTLVREVVASPESRGVNVVDFPTKF